MTTGGDIILAGVSALAGFLLSVIYDRYKERAKVSKELEANNYIDVSGDWFAAWQTSVDHTENINTEAVRLKQKGAVIEIRNLEKGQGNPKAGYLWSGTLHLYHGRDLLGWYFSVPAENSTAKGMYYYYFDANKKIFIGKWVGCSFDGPLMTGFGTIAKTREQALELLRNVMARHPHKSTIISYIHE